MKKRSLLFSIFTFLTLMALMPGLRVESQAATSTTKLTISSYSSTDTAIRINWNQVSSASGYVVYRYSGGEYVIIAEISGSSITTYRDSGLNDDSAYLYKVAAYYQSGNIKIWLDTSSVFTAKTDVETAQIISYSSTETAIRINWDEVSGAGGYRIYMQVNGSYVKIATVYGSDTTTYRLSNLLATTEYNFKIKAFTRDVSGNAVWGDASDAFIASTDTAQVDVKSSYTNTYDTITINWNKVTNADGYRIYKQYNGSYVAFADVSSSDTSYKFWALTPGTQYNIKVKAYTINSQGKTIWGEASDEFTCETMMTQASFSSYSCTYTAIRLNWNASPLVEGYYVYMYVNGSWKTIAFIDDPSTLTYRVENLEPGTRYKFKVCAFVRIESQIPVLLTSSNTYTASTKTAQVQMTTYSCTYNAIRINWQEVDNASGYRVYMYVDGKWKTLETVGSSTLTYRVEDLDPKTEYKFKVCAYSRNDDGVAMFLDSSDTYKASTTTIQVTMTTYSKTTDAVRINWKTLSSASGYRIYQYINGSWITLDTISGGSTTTYRISDLLSNSTYKFKVKAYVVTDSGKTIWLDASDTFVTQTL